MSPILRADAAGLARAVDALRAGELVALPTETVYGLAADARNPRAVARIFAAKGRPTDHPLIVHIGGPVELASWLDPVPNAAMRLAESFWPGPLTLVGRAAAAVPAAVTGGHDTVAVRCPSHPVASALLKAFGGALAAPSANRYGRLSPTRADHVAAEFGDRSLVILDGGPAEVGLESTIVDLSGAVPRILRPGRIGPAEIGATLGRPVAIAGVDDDDVPSAPGRRLSHYAPTVPLRLASPSTFAGALAEGDAALVRTVTGLPPGTEVRTLPLDADGYARAFYAALRQLDACHPRTIVVETPPEGEAWQAIHDRLARAAAPRTEGHES